MKIFILYFVKVWFAWLLILAMQYFFGAIEQPVDGVGLVGFPYIFYSFSPWYDKPQLNMGDFIANIEVMFFLGIAYAGTKYLFHRRK